MRIVHKVAHKLSLVTVNVRQTMLQLSVSCYALVSNTLSDVTAALFADTTSIRRPNAFALQDHRLRLWLAHQILDAASAHGLLR